MNGYVDCTVYLRTQILVIPVLQGSRRRETSVVPFGFGVWGLLSAHLGKVVLGCGLGVLLIALQLYVGDVSVG